MKLCSSCMTTKQLSEFHNDKRRGHSSRCKSCNKAAVYEWRNQNRDTYNAAERKRYADSPAKWARHLLSKYGITAEQYAERLEQQGGCCAICKAAATKTLAVDHDHKTGVVRGLLCAECNRMLGCAKDSPETLTTGATYLINAIAAQVFIGSLPMTNQPLAHMERAQSAINNVAILETA